MCFLAIFSVSNNALLTVLSSSEESSIVVLYGLVHPQCSACLGEQTTCVLISTIERKKGKRSGRQLHNKTKTRELPNASEISTTVLPTQSTTRCLGGQEPERLYKLPLPDKTVRDCCHLQSLLILPSIAHLEN